MSVTTASAALQELVGTLKAIDRLYDKRGDLSDAEDQQLSALEKRKDGLEEQLKREVKDKLGVDYFVLWHAITPSEKPPTERGRWL